jgi:DNA polymerase-3 subunit epsilon
VSAKKVLRVPELVVGFDTETTGLDVRMDRAISYGFSVFRFGQRIAEEQFFVVPDRPISPGAQRVHGVSMDDLVGGRVPGDVLTQEAGLARAIERLAQLHRAGAWVVGANVVRFDLEMLRRSAASVLGLSLQGPEFDISLLRVIDVIEHDLVIEPRSAARPSRSMEQLCRHYRVKPGGHDALFDARAAVEVLLEQVVVNNAGQVSLDLLVTGEDVLSG